MARVAGVDLPPNKRAQIGMTYIYGVGKSRATAILEQAGIDINQRIKDLSEDQLNQIRAILDSEGDIDHGGLPRRVTRGGGAGGGARGGPGGEPPSAYLPSH